MAQQSNPNNFPVGLAPQQPGIGDSPPFNTQDLQTQGVQHTQDQMIDTICAQFQAMGQQSSAPVFSDQAQPHLNPGQPLQLQVLKARVVESITQRKALLARELRDMQLLISVEAPGDIQAQQAREKLMEEFRMRMVQFKTQDSEIDKFNAMSDQDFAAWCADKRRNRPEVGQAMSFPQMGGQQPGPSSQPPQPPASMIPQQPPMAQINTPQLRPQVPLSPANHPPRGPTPFQLPANAQSLTQTSPSMQQQLPMQLPTGVRPGARPFAWPTMGVDMFRRAHLTYCQRNSIVVDQNLLQLEGRLVDLHALHTEVLGHGGWGRVTQNELWPVIAAKLGFVQIPGSDTEPVKSGPAVAQHVQSIYRRFLHGFDNMFLTSITSITKPKPQQGGNMNNGGQPGVPNVGQQGTPGPVAGPSTVTPTNNMPVGVQPNSASGGNGAGMANLTIPPGTDPKQINELMAYARHSAEELRRQGVSEHIINIVDYHRPVLEASLRAQQDFHGSLTKQQQPGANGNAGSGQGFQLDAGFPKTPQMGVAQPSASPAQHWQPMHPQGQPTSPGSQSQFAAQQQQQQQQPMKNPYTKPNIDVAIGQWPTPEELRQISLWLEKTRQQFMHSRGGQAMPFIELPGHEKTEWHALFQEVLGYLTNLQVKLPILTISIPEDSARNMTEAILTCFQQRSFLDGGRPDTRDTRKYMLSLAQVRQLRDDWRMWTATYNKYLAEHQQCVANAVQSLTSPTTLLP